MKAQRTMTTSNQFVRNAFLHSMKSEMLITILRQVFDFSTDQDFLVQIKHNFRWWGRVRSRRGRRRPRKDPKTEGYYSPKWSFFWWFAVEWLRSDPFSSLSHPLLPLVHKNNPSNTVYFKANRWILISCWKNKKLSMIGKFMTHLYAGQLQWCHYL